MFLNMVKHEFRASYRSLLPLFAGLIVMAALARLSIWLIDKTEFVLVQIFGGFFIGIFVLACIASIVLTMILMMVRFAKSVHGDEGYLTNTLPVNTSTIILSRLLVSFVALLTAYVAVFLGYKVCTLGIDGVRDFEKTFVSLFQQADKETVWTLLQFAATLLVGMIATILQIFAAISIGHSFPNKKAGFSVLFYFVLYFAAQSVSTVGLIILSLVLQNGLTDLEAFNNFPAIMMLFSLGANALMIGVYYFLTWIMMKKRLNLA